MPIRLSFARALWAALAIPILAALPGRAAAQTCTTIVPACPTNEPPRVTISPRTNPDSMATSVLVTVTIQDDRFMSGSPSFNLSLSGTASSWTANNTSGTYTGTLSLSNGINTLIVSITDDDGATGADTVTFISHHLSSPPAHGPPVLSFRPYSTTVRSIAGCSGCLYGGASYSTPAYVSRDVPRSVTLMYSSAQAVARGLMQVDAVINASTSPTGISMLLFKDGTSTPLTNGGTQAWYNGAPGTYRFGAQFDASALATGVYRYQVEINAYWPGNPYHAITTDSVRALIINEVNSPFGAGWTIAGLQKLTSIADSAVITNGSGDITFFRRTSSTAFATENGAIGALTVSGGVYTLTSSDGSWARFNSSGLMTATGNRFNDSTRYVYNGSKIDSIIDEVGKATTFTYAPDGICPGGSTSGTLCAITTPGGRVSKFVVDGSNDLVTILDPDGNTAFTGSYSSHKLTTATDRLGSSTKLAYDSFTGLSSVTTQAFTTTTTAGSTATDSAVTTYRSIEATLLSTSNTSSGSARALVRADTAYATVTAPNGTVVRMLLQGAGEPVLTEVKPLSGPTRQVGVSYNENYLPTAVSEYPVGGLTRYDWGGRDTLKAIIDPTGARTTFFTTNYLLPDSVVLNGSAIEKNTYSTFSGYTNLATSTRGSAQTTYSWNADGRMTQSSAAGSTTTISYVGSGFDNRYQVTNGASTTTVTHDRYGRDSVVSNPLSQATTTIYDALNRVTSLTQPGSAVTSISISENTTANRATVTVTDPRSLTFTTKSNPLAWADSVVDPHGGLSRAGYDRNGFLRRAVNRAGGVVTASYDSLGRPVSITANGNTTTFVYDAATLASAPHWSVGATADSRDSVNTDTQGRPTVATSVRGGMSFTITSTYNAQGDRNLLKISNGFWTDSLMFATDAHSYPYQLPDWGYNWTRVHYRTDRLIDTVEFPTGLRMLPTGYNRFFRPDTMTVKAGGTLKSRVRYAYDDLGRLGRADSGDVTRDYYSRQYTYDARGRLYSYSDTRYYVSDSTREPCPPPEIICDPMPPWEYFWSTTTIRGKVFAPDYSGNRTDGSASLSNDRLSSMTGSDGVAYSFTYDNEGRRTAKTASGYAQTYGWNDLGQLVWVKTGSDSVAYGYDAAGRRVRKYSSNTGQTAHYVWDGENLVAEVDGSGNRVRQYAYQPGIDRPVSVTVSGATRYYYQLDEEGNIVSVWNTSNAKVADYTYEPFGYLVASSASLTQPLRWKGREFDQETGLYYMRARYYDPTVGRFISEDPIGLEGGINPYTFADGEPVNRSDPSGRCWVDFTIEFLGKRFGLRLFCGKGGTNDDTAIQGDTPKVFAPNFGRPGTRGDRPASPGAEGGGTGASPSSVGPNRTCASHEAQFGGGVQALGGLPIFLGVSGFLTAGVEGGVTTSGRLYAQAYLGGLTGVGAIASGGLAGGVEITPIPTALASSGTNSVTTVAGGLGALGFGFSTSSDGQGGRSVSVDAKGLTAGMMAGHGRTKNIAVGTPALFGRCR